MGIQDVTTVYHYSDVVMEVKMSNYIELPVNSIQLDIDNPRIARGLAHYGEITSDLMALLLGSTSESCASLRESIRENGGIIHPIVVNKKPDGTYVVIEGNTRLQIYKDFIKNGEPGDWSKIRAIVYDNLTSDNLHAIRLQAHLIGPREWDPYSKALYLNHLANVEHMPMATLISFCGGNSKAAEIRNMIAAYNDMENYYRPLCGDDSEFDVRKFHGFVELQNRNIIDSLTAHGFTKKDFSQWMIDDRFSTLQDVRRLPEILNSKRAFDVFLKENSREAKKILSIEEITIDKLKDVPYELLAQELSKRMTNIPLKEVHHLRDDVDYSEKLRALNRVYDEVGFVLEQIQGD